MLIKEICPGVGVQRVEVEDIEVFNIQALVGSTLIYFNVCSLEHTNYLITLDIWLWMKCLILHFYHQRASSPLSKLYLRCVASLWWWNTETYLHEILLLKLWVSCEQYIYLFNNSPPHVTPIPTTIHSLGRTPTSCCVQPRGTPGLAPSHHGSTSPEFGGARGRWIGPTGESFPHS